MAPGGGGGDRERDVPRSGALLHIHGTAGARFRAPAPIRARSRMSGRQSDWLLDLSKSRETRRGEPVPSRAAGRLAQPTMCRRRGSKMCSHAYVRRSLVPCLTRGAGPDLCTSARSRQGPHKRQKRRRETPRRPHYLRTVSVLTCRSMEPSPVPPAPQAASTARS